MRRPTKNAILDSLPPEEFEQVAAKISSDDLPREQVLHRCGERIEAIYFVTEGLVPVIDSMRDGLGVEISLIGCEGIAGIQAFLGNEIASYHTRVQIPGKAYTLKTRDALRAFDACPSFRKIVLRYAHSVLAHAAKSASCNRLHEVEQRLARSLLIISDRLGSKEFYLTHKYLALMLGTRRTTLTLAARSLQDGGAIKYSRGNIRILNRQKLRKSACECYRALSGEMRRFLHFAFPTRSAPSRRA